jgi:subfamily B ATP-binding cassette protein HlyB/CyaB
LSAGKEIINQDARDDRRLYVVRQGEVRILCARRGPSDYVLATLRARRDLRREGLFAAPGAAWSTAIANTETRLLVIPEKTVHFVLERNPKLREVLEERIRFTGTRTGTTKARRATTQALPPVLDLHYETRVRRKE